MLTPEQSWEQTPGNGSQGASRRQEEATEEEGESTWSQMAPQREPRLQRRSAGGWNAVQGFTEESKLRESQPSRFQGLRKPLMW